MGKMVCAVCGIEDRCKRCELVNGSWLTLCAPCRRRHDEMIASVPVSGPQDRRQEEDAALDGVERCSCEESLALRRELRRQTAQTERFTRWNLED